MHHHHITKSLLFPIVALIALLSGCIAPIVPPADSADPAAGPLPVVATYSILGDLVANVGGDHVEVVTLVGPDGDAHTFEPTPADGVALTEAALIFANGVEFETWLPDLYSAAGATAQQVIVSEGLDLRTMDEHGDEHAEKAPAVAPRRLFVADGKEGVVRLLNLDDGETLAEYTLSGPARLYPSPSDTLAFAIQREQNLVNVLDSGVRFVEHEDHYDLDLSDPTMLDFALELAEPTHFVVHGEQIVFFNDGDGTATLITEATTRGGDAPLTFETGRAHHGVAVTLGDAMLLSLPDPNDEKAILPVGVTVHSMDGAEVARFADCPGLHGEASIGEAMVAFGCSDGVLLVQRDGDSFSTQKIANPADNPNAARVGTLHYSAGADLLIGNFSREGITLFDLAALTMTPLRTPSPLWAFALAEHDPHTIVVLTLDGNLHTIDGESGAITGSVAVIPAFEPPQRGVEGVVLPALHVAGEMAYISDPNAGTVTEVHLAEMAVERTLTLPGAPYSLAAFGALADVHAGEHQAGEAHADEHGHHHGEFDPHVWHDVANAMAMVEAIRDALSAADPDNAAAYASNADAYLAELAELDAWVTEQIATIPPDRRKLVTAHDTFGYFAQRYGLEIVGSALGSLSTEAGDPSAGALATLIETIQAAGVPALFAENVSNPELIERIAQETGVTIGEPLYTDALGAAGTPGATYIDMVRYNVTAIVTALSQ
jgi:ABC-type Zn uptake system ZnuABC Zn-binding protein ZnuA